ncbi:4898_t:CDS:2 [Acaulospora colombiana]|uniref:4898_t:CDS:1 n=1 Tax=Acaulospora colombiana TaxID=27376 RepID=A0ACA9M5B3_9GLOM|nr:4898_t:CDS:2 [Acaulospora colombiana]
MDVQQDQRISKLLPTVKCSDCGETVEFRNLADHLCSVAPAVPELPLAYKNNTKIGKGVVTSSKKQPNLSPLFVDNDSSYYANPSPTDSEHSNYSNKFVVPNANPTKSKPARSFLQKYQQVTGKPINSPSFQPPPTPTSERSYSDASDLQDRPVNNSNGNGMYYKDAGTFDNNIMQKNQGYGASFQTDRERQPEIRKMTHARPYDQGYEYPSYENNQNQYRNEDPYLMKQRQPHPNNNHLNGNMDRGQGNYLRNPNDGYGNGEYMRREEPRSRSRSPAPGYDRQNFNQLQSHSYGASQPLRQAPYDQHNGQLPYGQDNYRSQNPYIPPQENNSDSSYMSNNNNGGHKSKNASFSSTGSAVSGGQKYVENRNTNGSNGSKDSFKSDFDDLMEDLLREMDNMQTPSAQNKGKLEQSSNHSKTPSSPGKQKVQSETCAYWY